MNDRPSIVDFRGPQVWFGFLASLGGLLADEWPTPIRMGPVMFFGGLMLGIGLMRNFHQRVAREGTDRSDPRRE